MKRTHKRVPNSSRNIKRHVWSRVGHAVKRDALQELVNMMIKMGVIRR